MGRYPVTQEQWRVVADWSEYAERELDPDPSYFKEDYKGISRWQRPVENVSWSDAKEFCNRLSKKNKRDYRLPTEAEWEYACRSVISEEMSVNDWNEKYNQPFHFGKTISTDLANYRGTDWLYEGKVFPGNYEPGLKGIYREQTIPVKHFEFANNFGLWDMHGNIWEWCEDDWHHNYIDAPTDGGVWLSKSNNRKVIRGGSWDFSHFFCRSAFRLSYNPDDHDNDFGFRVVCVAPFQ